MSTIVEHVPGTYYVEFRQDYVALCKACTYRKSDKSKASPYCKALILAILEKWTNDKILKKKEPYVYMTNAQWIEEMYGMFGRCVILDSLEELVGEELITREKYRIHGRDSYKYLLNVPVLNKGLAEWTCLKVDTSTQNIDTSYLEVDRTDGNVDTSQGQSEHKPEEDVSKSSNLIDSKNLSNNQTKKEGEAPNVTEVSYSLPSSSQISFYTLEEQRIDDYFHQVAGRRATQSKDTKRHWNTVSKKIESPERFESLYAHVHDAIKNDPKYTVKVVHPGNLAGYLLEDWEARQTSTDEFWKRKQPTPTEDKQDEFIGAIVEKIATGLREVENLDVYTARVKLIYRCTDVSEADFKEMMRDVYQPMIQPTVMTLEEVQRYRDDCEGVMDYFVWNLASSSGVPIDTLLTPVDANSW